MNDKTTIERLAERLAERSKYQVHDVERFASDAIRKGLTVDEGVRLFDIAVGNLYVAEGLLRRKDEKP